MKILRSFVALPMVPQQPVSDKSLYHHQPASVSRAHEHLQEGILHFSVPYRVCRSDTLIPRPTRKADKSSKVGLHWFGLCSSLGWIHADTWACPTVGSAYAPDHQSSLECSLRHCSQEPGIIATFFSLNRPYFWSIIIVSICSMSLKLKIRTIDLS